MKTGNVYRCRGGPPPFDLANRPRTSSPVVRATLDRIHDDADIRRADLIQLEQIASGYPSRERFLTELTQRGRRLHALGPGRRNLG